MTKLINKFLISKAVTEETLRIEEQINYPGVHHTPLNRSSPLKQESDFYLRLGQFINFLETRQESKNPFNVPGVREVLIRRCGILNERIWTSYKEFDKVIGYRLSSGRSHVEADLDQVMKQMAFAIIFGASEPDIKNTILLDRNGRIVDGAQRVKAFRGLPDFPFYTIMIDYVHPDDEFPTW